MKKFFYTAIVAILTAAIIGVFFDFLNFDKIKSACDFFRPKIVGERTVDDVVKKYQKKVEGQFGKTEFINCNGFPKEILIYIKKHERDVSLYGRMKSDDEFQLLRTYPFTGFSGELGPKTKQGDMQIPEGIYQIESLNPNSKFHLALRVSYPNFFDKQMAARDGRALNTLGGEIMIHGRKNTIGCIPVGDAAIEEIFVIAAKSKSNKIIISPANHLDRDFWENLKKIKNPQWYQELLEKIRGEILKDLNIKM